MIKRTFSERHIGPRSGEIQAMLDVIGADNMDQLIDNTLPPAIRLTGGVGNWPAMSEQEYMQHIRAIAAKNKLYRSYIGMGYYGTNLPSVIQRNILENPSWYTSYTPYQAEISQGRLEALLNFQTLCTELTGMELANASLLDEATAAAEAMIMMYNARPRKKAKAGANRLLASSNIYPQTLDLLRTHAAPLDIELVIDKDENLKFDEKVFGLIVQYPAADGKINNYKALADKAHRQEALVSVMADLLSLTLLSPPGEWGADIVAGTTQRFGIPMGYGGPHAGYFTSRESLKRHMPGRIIGVTRDVNGNTALRMALQTREQHIKRERATSNICTAQALLATMAGMYAVYHGPKGLREIAEHAHSAAATLETALEKMGYIQKNKNYFDTLLIKMPGQFDTSTVEKEALAEEINLNIIDGQYISVSMDECVSTDELNRLIAVFAKAIGKQPEKVESIRNNIFFDDAFKRTSTYLQQEVFKLYHSETEMMRYIKKLERKDFSLTHSMIPLGSCTMKLNPATAMLPLSWPGFGNIHPFVPKDQAAGYSQLMDELEEDLCKITGFKAISFQPNSGASGEYTGLMVIREYLADNGQANRKVVLIPASAHGTNPASAVMAGMDVVVVKCDEKGNIDVNDLKDKAQAHKDTLAAFMVTYPSTHGVFEADIMEMIGIIHQNGGLVYMDGANMNAQAGLTNPAYIGADVCHLNLHKTFAIPHGGGGPGMGPIGVNDKLVNYLPKHPVVKTGGSKGITAVAAAPYGSPLILPISHAYIKMLGSKGLTESTRMAILNANYLAARLKDYYQILYTGTKGCVAHEMILECRNFKQEAGISEADIAKRLMDYGFHAPTLSFPVHGTLMVEPTESESKQELDRFADALIAIYKEIQEVKEGKADKDNNVLRNAPHTQFAISTDNWERPYARSRAAFPLKWVADNKFWPASARVDDAYGDRNLVCTCEPIEHYM